MKKYAFFLMGPDYTPAKHTATFETPGLQSHIFTVNNLDDAKTLAKQCLSEGFGAIELCGAFGADAAEDIIKLTNGKLAVGYVVHRPEQDPLFDAFFGGP